MFYIIDTQSISNVRQSSIALRHRLCPSCPRREPFKSSTCFFMIFTISSIIVTVVVRAVWHFDARFLLDFS